VGQMHADLVGAAGLEPALDQRSEGPARIAERLHDPIPGAGCLAAATQNRHALAVERAAADVALDHAVARAWRAPHDGVVCPLDSVIGELLGETLHRALGLRGNQQTAGVLVETMDDARPRFAADAGKL